MRDMLGGVWWYMHLSIEISILACYVYSNHLLEEEVRILGVGDTLASKCKGVVGQSFRQDISLAKDLNTEGPFSTGCCQSKNFALCLIQSCFSSILAWE